MNFLNKIDLYRKVPNDFSQSSNVGGLFSLLAIALICFVIVLEIVALISVDHESHVELDHSAQQNLYLNFNVTVHQLPCDLVKLTVKDIFSEKERVVSMLTVNKFTQEGYWQGSALQSHYISYEDKTKSTKIPEYLKFTLEKDPQPIRDAEEERRKVEEARDGSLLVQDLDQVSFKYFTQQSTVSFVTFYAPWCEPCKPLAEEFNRAAFLSNKKLADLPDDEAASKVKTALKEGNSLKFGRIDCTRNKEMNTICKEMEIVEYPAVVIFGDREKMRLSGAGQHIYNGVRKAEAISTHALSMFYLVLTGTRVEGEPKTGGSSILRTKGCRVEGAVPINKVPTELIIKAESDIHMLNSSLFSMDHTIHQLSMGNMKAAYRPSSGKALDPVKQKKLIEDSEQRELSVQREIQNAFFKTHGAGSVKRIGISEALRTNADLEFIKGGMLGYDHYIKVVPITLLPRYSGEKSYFDYTLQTHTHGTDYGEIAELTLKVEVSPLRLILEEKAKSLSTSFLNIMALVGGIFSSFLIFERAVCNVITIVSKKKS